MVAAGAEGGDRSEGVDGFAGLTRDLQSESTVVRWNSTDPSPIEVRNGVAFVELARWQDFHDLMSSDGVDWSTYIYRGQQDHPEVTPFNSRLQDRIAVAIEPALERALAERRAGRGVAVKNAGEAVELEFRKHGEMHLEAFKDATAGLLQTDRDKMTEDRWWALGRHFGLKTPLLDWSEAPYVAAFFAVAEALRHESSQRAVYALSEPSMNAKFSEFERANKARGPGELSTPVVEIKRLRVDDNPRLLAQRGLFTKAGYIDIERWVAVHFRGSDEPALIRISIPDDGRVDFLRCLKKMNITHSTLFPDLDGAAQYCNMRLDLNDY